MYLTYCTVLRAEQLELRPQVTCMKNLMKYEHVVLEICERTERQTYTLIARICEVIIAIY